MSCNLSRNDLCDCVPLAGAIFIPWAGLSIGLAACQGTTWPTLCYMGLGELAASTACAAGCVFHGKGCCATKKASSMQDIQLDTPATTIIVNRDSSNPGALSPNRFVHSPVSDSLVPSPIIFSYTPPPALSDEYLEARRVVLLPPRAQTPP